MIIEIFIQYKIMKYEGFMNFINLEKIFFYYSNVCSFFVRCKVLEKKYLQRVV